MSESDIVARESDIAAREPQIAARGSDAVLSVTIRARTAPLHARVEQLLGLPGAITDELGYGRWLARLLGLYEPLERSFRAFDEWDRLELPLGPRNRCFRLSGDLLALGIDPQEIPRASPAMLPQLATFPHALGALYVLEGSALGGRIILRELEARLGPGIAGATRFLCGHGEETGAMWKLFRATLDRFGDVQPHRREDVVTGAERTFDAILAWFTSFHEVRISGHDVEVSGHDVEGPGHDVEVSGRDVEVPGHDVDVPGRDVGVSGRDAEISGRGVGVSGP